MLMSNLLHNEFDYNSTREQLQIPEYGRIIQRIATHLKHIEDKDKRNLAANTLIHFMGSYHPQIRDNQDFKHILWDHLFIMAGLDLDVESPYPKPTEESIHMKAERIPYSGGNIKVRHYGRVVEKFISKARELQEGQQREFLIDGIANAMKLGYRNYNSANINDDEIVADLHRMSEGEIALSSDYKIMVGNAFIPVNRNASSKNSKYAKNNRNKNRNSSSNNNNNNNKRRNNNNRRPMA